MTYDNFDLGSFFKGLESHFKDRAIHPKDDSSTKGISPNTGECFFLFDFTRNQLIHIGGMEQMFGYDTENIDLNFAINILHPDESLLVQRILQSCVSQIINSDIPKYTNAFKINSRHKKSDGTYINVLSENFVYQLNDQNMVQSILIRYTDVSFLNKPEAVEWWVDSDYLNEKAISDFVYGERKNLFTKREEELILLIFSGNKNADIAKELNISAHTVSTHRRNIFSKSGCSNVEELKLYCKKNGVLI